MTVIQDFVKALQSVVMPELAALRERVDGNHREVMLRFDGMNQRFDDLLDRLDLHKRVQELERERKAS